jgi:YegS/Rv2252/BmrU family lipid kinase
VTTVAVVAHGRKRLGGGLPELRACLERAGISDPIWHEVDKSKKAPKRARRALEEGADLVLVWGGDGTVQRCIDALAGSGVVVGILPAGTANLFAANLGVPTDLEEAVEIALHGARRELDVGAVNGERFVVMAGCGFDALMIRDADRGRKDRLGRLAYLWSGAHALQASVVKARVDVDGERWFSGRLSCLLVGNVGKILAGIEAFEHASPSDGRLDLGVVTASNPVQWIRALTRTAFGRADCSPFVRTTSGRKIHVRLERKVPYELDGGARKSTKRLRIHVEPRAITVAVPEGSAP